MNKKEELQVLEKKKAELKVRIINATKRRSELIEQEREFTIIIKELNKSFIEAEAEENRLAKEEVCPETVKCPTCGHKKGEESEN